MEKQNPLKLNPLQLRTMAILQRLAMLEGKAVEAEVTLYELPRPHGDHFHVGAAVIPAPAASGLHNPSVWIALARRGLVKGSYPGPLTVTQQGRAYPTGELGIFHEHSHHEH